MTRAAPTTWFLATLELDGGPVACLGVADMLYPLAKLAAASGKSAPNEVMPLFADWDASKLLLGSLAAGAEASGVAGVPVAGAPLLAPLLYPGKILCAGANYFDHMAEMGFPDVKKETQRLFFFMKPPRQAIVGAGNNVEIPRDTQKFDWEIELAAVIGKTARYVSVEDALSYVGAYTIAIDLSARDSNQAPDQFYKLDWVAGKANDTCCPLGPWVVPADSMGDPQAVAMKLWVNGVLKQDSDSSKMIFSIAEQISRASEIMTLEPGDLILTGTPAGVGVARKEFLSPGDTIDAEIAGIGRLSVSIRG